MKIAIHIFRWILSHIRLIIAVISIAIGIYLIPFFLLYSDQLLILGYQHLRMIGLAMPPAIGIGVGLGIWIHQSHRRAWIVLGMASIIMTIPSIALFGAMIPFLAPLGGGVGTVPAVIALILYSQLPIIRNTYQGLKNVEPGVMKAALGMGMTRREILFRIQLPLALPVIFAGIRIAVVMGVGIAAVAAYIGAGGYGRWIFGGIRRTYPQMVLAGALVISLLAIFLDTLLARLQWWLTPAPLRNFHPH